MPVRDRMSVMDATLLYLETKTVSFDMAGLFRVNGPIDFDRYVTDLSHRLEHLPRFRQRVLRVPLGLSHPTWETDPNFVFRDHVVDTRLSAPGGEVELDDFLESVMQDHLDMTKPPWMAYVINGLENDHAAVLIKLHHCVTDGTGGHKVYAAFVDFQNPTLRTEEAPPWNQDAPPLPGKFRRIGYAVVDSMSAWRQSRRSPTAAKAPQEERDRRAALMKRFKKSPALRFGFNGLLSGRIRHLSTRYPLAELRAIREVHGGTVNDVLLTMLGEVTSRVAREEGMDPDGRFLRVHLAANRRTKDNQDEWGNRVALLPALVPLGIDDPMTCLKEVTAFTREAKESNVVESMEEWINQTQKLPAPFLRWFLRFMFSDTFNRFIFRFNRPPLANMYVTNVRWPEVSSYMGGRDVVDVRPLLPLMPGIGLICSAITYGDELNVSFSGDPTLTMPLDDLIAYLDDAFDRLRTAAAVSGSSRAPHLQAREASTSV